MGEDQGVEVGLWATMCFQVEGKTYDKELGQRYGAKAKQVAWWIPRGRKAGGTRYSPEVIGWQESGERWDWSHPAQMYQWAQLMSSFVWGIFATSSLGSGRICYESLFYAFVVVSHLKKKKGAGSRETQVAFHTTQHKMPPLFPIGQGLQGSQPIWCF